MVRLLLLCAGLIGACEGFGGLYLGKFGASPHPKQAGGGVRGRFAGETTSWRSGRVEAGMAGAGGAESDSAGNSTSSYEKVGAFGNLRSGGGGFKLPDDSSPDAPNYKVKPASENPVLKAADAAGGGGTEVFDEMQKKASFEHVSDTLAPGFWRFCSKGIGLSAPPSPVNFALSRLVEADLRKLPPALPPSLCLSLCTCT